MSGEIKKSSIYTRTGDTGSTSLYNGQRQYKDHITFDAIGSIDELIAFISLCIQSPIPDLNDDLIRIMAELMDVGSAIATPRDSSSPEKLARTQFSPDRLNNLERAIDRMDSTLPRLTKFILPSGHKISCRLHVCRTICRRAERIVVSIVRDNPTSIDPIICKYLNRLSDYFFVAARYVNHQLGMSEITIR